MLASEFLINQRKELDQLCTYDIPLHIRAELKNNKFAELEVKDIAVIRVDEGFRLQISLEEVDDKRKSIWTVESN